MQHKEFKEFYEKRAEKYEYKGDKQSRIVYYSRKFNGTKKNLHFLKGKILDAGCGDGIYSTYLSLQDRYSTIVSLDISSNILHSALRRIRVEGNPRAVNFIQGDVEHLPFKDSFFDGVISTMVLEHLFDDYRGLEELNRVLIKNGILIISVPNRGNTVTKILNLPIEFFSTFMKLILSKNLKRQLPIHREYDMDSLAKMIRNAKFTVHKVETFRFSLPYPLYRNMFLTGMLDSIEKRLIRYKPFLKWGDIILIVARK